MIGDSPIVTPESSVQHGGGMDATEQVARQAEGINLFYSTANLGLTSLFVSSPSAKTQLYVTKKPRAQQARFNGIPG